MASQNYLIAIALIEQNLLRAMPLGGKEIKDNLEESENLKKLGEEVILNLLMRVFQRSDEGALKRASEEKEREPYVNDVINREIIKSCICIEGNCALHVKNNIEYSSIDFGNGKKCFRVYKENNNLKKEIL